MTAEAVADPESNGADPTGTDPTGTDPTGPEPTGTDAVAIEASTDADLDTAARLEEIRADALALAAQLDLDMRAVSEARDASNVDDEHDPEGSTIAFERSQLGAVRDSARARAFDVTAALERLADGTYGFCLNCGRPIAGARLVARPMAALCLACAS